MSTMYTNRNYFLWHYKNTANVFENFLVFEIVELGNFGCVYLNYANIYTVTTFSPQVNSF